MPPGNCDEDDLHHLLMDGLLALQDACGSWQVLADTHLRNFLKQPIAKISCSALASSARVWPALVVPLEFRVRRSGLHPAIGQLMGHCQEAALQQRDREHVYGVAVFIDAVVVLRFNMEHGNVTSVQRSGVEPLAVSSASAGLRLVARILQASREQLGYSMPA